MLIKKVLEQYPNLLKEIEKLNKKDLMSVNGGGILDVGLLIGAGIVFIIGVIDGFMRPLKCN